MAAEQEIVNRKFPRTPHFPFSPGRADDDVVLSWASHEGVSRFPLFTQEVVITEKLDGGNCSIFRGKVYARTASAEATHMSFGPIKQLASQLSYILPDNIQLFGENMYGIHSIEYDALHSFFYIFAALRDGEEWLSWEEVGQLAEETGLHTVPEIGRGQFGSFQQYESYIVPLMKNTSYCGSCQPEGFVVRTLEGFSYDKFGNYMAKFVRHGHIQTDESWRRTWRAAKLKM